jgi:hypothetical protein
MKLQNQYVNGPIIDIIIRHITIKFSVTYDISPARFVGINTVFQTKFEIQKTSIC